MKKKWVVVLIGIAACLLFLQGCDSSGDDEKLAPAWEQPPAPAYEYTQTPEGEVKAPVVSDQLSPEEMAKVTVLRTAITQGLHIAEIRYIEAVSLALQDFGVTDDYEGSLEEDPSLETEPEPCPFAKYYDNGFEPTGYACDYLVDLAKVEVYSELSKLLDENPLPDSVNESEHVLEANFWYEQGAISAIEKQRVMVRNDLKARNLCNTKPTPVESSHEKGVTVGRQLFAAQFNSWLSSNGYMPDYPTMSQPIQVCNADQTMLEPALKEALNSIEQKVIAEPLCEDYEPPTQEGVLQYAQAKLDYEKGLKEGVESEFSLAAVKVFQVIPCNVSEPLVLDLDRDGLELLSVDNGVDFDIWGMDRRQAVAWVSPDDGFLAMDRNGNGAIDNGTELFGNIDARFADGFEHVAELDQPEYGGNLDGLLTPDDAAFRYLLVWRDANTDGVSTSDELSGLLSIGVDSIDLDAASANLVSGGNRITRTSYMFGKTGSMLCGDAYLHSAPYSRLTGAR